MSSLFGGPKPLPMPGLLASPYFHSGKAAHPDPGTMPMPTPVPYFPPPDGAQQNGRPGAAPPPAAKKDLLDREGAEPDRELGREAFQASIAEQRRRTAQRRTLQAVSLDTSLPGKIRFAALGPLNRFVRLYLQADSETRAKIDRHMEGDVPL